MKERERERERERIQMMNEVCINHRHTNIELILIIL